MNAIEVSHREEYVLDTTKKICIFFAVGRELEEWYWGVKTASELIYRVCHIDRKCNSIFIFFF